MRAVTRLSQGVISATNPTRPRIAQGRYARSMAGLYVPRDQLGSTSQEQSHVENLAYGAVGSNNNGRFITRFANANNWPTPRIRSDVYGSYWDFNDTPNWRFMVSGTTTTQIPWRPGDNGGYQAGTLMAIVRHTSAPSGDQTYFGFGGPTVFIVGATGGSLYGYIRLGTGNPAPSVIAAAPTVGDPYALFFTTRAVNDHQCIMVNLRSGTVNSGTSTTNLGTAGGIPNTCAIGSYQFDITSVLEFSRAVRIYQCAVWLRGMTQAEMQDIARQAFVLSTPSIRRVPSFDVPAVPVTGMRNRPRLITGGHWLA